MVVESVLAPLVLIGGSGASEQAASADAVAPANAAPRNPRRPIRVGASTTPDGSLF